MSSLTFKENFIWKGCGSSSLSNESIIHTGWKNVLIHFQLRHDRFPIYSIFGVGESVFNRKRIPFILSGSLTIDGNMRLIKTHVSQRYKNQTIYDIKINIQDITKIQGFCTRNNQQYSLNLHSTSYIIQAS